MNLSKKHVVKKNNNISLHVTPTSVNLWHGPQPLNQFDKAIDLICDAIQILTSFESMNIRIYCTLKVANSNDVVIL